APARAGSAPRATPRGGRSAPAELGARLPAVLRSTEGALGAGGLARLRGPRRVPLPELDGERSRARVARGGARRHRRGRRGCVGAAAASARLLAERGRRA